MSDCLECGLCCRKLEVEVEAADLEVAPELRPVVTEGWLDGTYVLKLACQDRCPMLTSSGCSVYGRHPEVCREFAVGGDACNALRAGAGLPPIPERDCQSA